MNPGNGKALLKPSGAISTGVDLRDEAVEVAGRVTVAVAIAVAEAAVVTAVVVVQMTQTTVASVAFNKNFRRLSLNKAPTFLQLLLVATSAAVQLAIASKVAFSPVLVEPKSAALPDTLMRRSVRLLTSIEKVAPIAILMPIPAA